MICPRGRRPDGIVQPFACASSEVSSHRFPIARSSSAQMQPPSGGRTEPGKSFSSRTLNWLPSAHTHCLDCCAVRPEPNGRWHRRYPPGTPFVLLDQHIVAVAGGMDTLERTLQLRIVAAGRDHADPTALALPLTPKSTALRPLAPVHLKATRAAGGVTFNWVRRTRIEGDNWVGEVPLREDSEQYVLDILSGPAVVRSIIVAAPMALYASADELSDFGAPQSRLDRSRCATFRDCWPRHCRRGQSPHLGASMTDTPRLALPAIEAAQAQKHVTHNEALVLLDALTHLSVKSRALSAPPGSPSEGSSYIPAPGASGAWSGLDAQIALYSGGAWIRIAPVPGIKAWVRAERLTVTYEDGAMARRRCPDSTWGACDAARQGRRTEPQRCVYRDQRRSLHSGPRGRVGCCVTHHARDHWRYVLRGRHQRRTARSSGIFSASRLDRQTMRRHRPDRFLRQHESARDCQRRKFHGRQGSPHCLFP